MDIELAKKVSVEAVREAGKVLLSHFRNNPLASSKGKSDIVTEADLEAEKVIIHLIQSSFSDHSILSEEKGSMDRHSDYLWILDPLDGTINYYYGFEYFGTGLCLLEKEKLLISAIYNPVQDKLFFAERGKGATMNGSFIKVNHNSELKNSIVVTHLGSKDEARMRTIAVLDSVFRKSMHMRILGSPFVTLPQIASGVFDVFFNIRTNPWDILPGALIVEEAGGKVTDIRGGEITSESTSILATNGKVHDQMLELLKNA